MERWHAVGLALLLAGCPHREPAAAPQPEERLAALSLEGQRRVMELSDLLRRDCPEGLEALAMSETCAASLQTAQSAIAEIRNALEELQDSIREELDRANTVRLAQAAEDGMSSITPTRILQLDALVARIQRSIEELDERWLEAVSSPR